MFFKIIQFTHESIDSSTVQCNSINMFHSPDDMIAKYQPLLENEPQSRVFALLAEAYRKKGDLNQAFKICSEGVTRNPNFASGQFTLGRILNDLHAFEDAFSHLEIAIKIAPENLAAQQLYANLALYLKKPKQALNAFKTILFLDPKNSKAISLIKKLESLTADEFEEELFSILPLQSIKHDLFATSSQKKSSQEDSSAYQQKQLERFLSLSDAFIVRNDFNRALETLKKAKLTFGINQDIQARLQIVLKKTKSTTQNQAPQPQYSASTLKKVQKLKNLLKRLEFNI